MVALEPGQVRKEAALRDDHQVPLLTDGALSLLYTLEKRFLVSRVLNLITWGGRLGHGCDLPTLETDSLG